MNLQQIFDTGVRGVLAQGCASIALYDGLRSCRFRRDLEASDPVRCAVGHSIADEEYQVAFDTDVSLGEINRELDWDVDEGALYDFQKCHDNATVDDDFIESFKTRAAAFADEHGLNKDTLNG